MPYRWLPLLGDFTISEDTVAFHGAEFAVTAGSTQPAVGVVMSDVVFGGGSISARMAFSGPTNIKNACGVILYRQPTTQAFITAQLGGEDFASVWTFANGQWAKHGGAGIGTMIQPDKEYEISIAVAGSSVALTVDGIDLLSATLPIPLPRGNVGFWCRGVGPIRASLMSVVGMTPKAFVVMQFTAPFNELFTDVIDPICTSMGLRAERAADVYGPGVIIQDIERQIVDARIIIADITPKNLNVYYEVGFAHALRKDTILIAEKPTELPFDVSPFRVLFYENSIPGKARIEAGLKKHLEAILSGNRAVAV